MSQPNLLFVFADQWRGQAFGYAGDRNLSTPNIDDFASEGVCFTNAVSNAPVCGPHRAILMTGLYPHLNGMVANDQCLAENCSGPYLADCLKQGGYQTAYIGKWHLDGHGRRKFVPPERRLGFESWWGFECNHDYWDAPCFHDSPEPETLTGYESFAQLELARNYLGQKHDKPFALFLSWGPPHDPYGTAPEEYRQRHSPESVKLRPNVPAESQVEARRELAGYYAHCEALDFAFGQLLAELESTGLAENTIVIFTSDHGDMLGSQGHSRKQRHYDESILVPLLIRDPRVSGPETIEAPISTIDLMPTLLGLCDCRVPERCQGSDWSRVISGNARPPTDAALIACQVPFHQYKASCGGQAYRGLRTNRYTYVRFIDGARQLFDNLNDPYQLNDLAAEGSSKELLESLETRLQELLAASDDPFAQPEALLKQWSVKLNEEGDVYYD
jgi:arylsulfatase A-like enzyme